MHSVRTRVHIVAVCHHHVAHFVEQRGAGSEARHLPQGPHSVSARPAAAGPAAAAAAATSAPEPHKL